MCDVVVLGAGAAGIAAGLALGPRAVVLEGAPGPGGLAGSLEFEGAVFDIGGHSFHTPHPAIRRLVEESVELFSQRRKAHCFSHGCLIPYPFQKHFRQLSDKRAIDDCVEGLRRVRTDDGSRAPNFEVYLERRFGFGVSRHFMTPYNRRLWGRDLSRLTVDWVGERVAAPEGVAEAFDESGGERKPLQPDTMVSYPARGGFAAIFDALAMKLPDARYGERVSRIDLERRTVTTHPGRTQRYEHLVSTLPLPELIRLCENVPKAIEEDVASLEYLSLKVVLLVVDHPIHTDVQRVYCADDTVPAHKIAFNHNSSDYLRRIPRHGIMAEVSCVNGKTPTDERLTTWTIRGLQHMRLLPEHHRVIATRVLSVKYAYPVPTLQRDAVVARVRDWLGAHRAHTVGRFGEWAYINSDEAMSRGFILGTRLLS